MENPTLSCREVAPRAANRVRLPPEIILHIVDCVVPPPSDTIATLPPSHIVTRTLVALSTASRITCNRAQRLLRRRCIYLDSHQRAASFLQTLQAAKNTLPKEMRLAAPHRAPAMFLAPFDGEPVDLETARLVRALLHDAGPRSLRRLVVRMPFAALRASNPAFDNVRMVLREGFARLPLLEELAVLEQHPERSESSSLYLDDIYGIWPKLRRLLVFGVDADDWMLWESLAWCPCLTDVVLARPWSLGLLDMKRTYFEAVEEQEEIRTKRKGARLRLMLMDVSYDVQGIQTDGWAECDPEGLMTIEVYEVPTAYYGDETAQDTVAAWVSMGVRSGKIWEWRGEVVK